MGLLRGLDRKLGAKFSFLISIPTIGGAALVKGLEAVQRPLDISWGIVGLGTVVAFVSGIFAIKVLLKFLEEGKLKSFAIYCWLIGSITVIISMVQ